ncbi:hypothetical protein CC1G_05702 [Coprinopsis cinerea okayama7|uniref:Solute carrier family 40 member n=1 Tax=Coprinopsis cinerea (strain Okayama-7 / 130 / ATCC MYA-4618 / FGSC 9003) TaxID=240176 RepID=A8N9X5_COPC7|nr:hypothetical protein CC1G_05702 [Coprinopsis cinerea okayama7\|eukprot:XP_001831631.2 hypothetical protein CC1G_05702 [Coprinopsis cinerea okayama7\
MSSAVFDPGKRADDDKTVTLVEEAPVEPDPSPPSVTGQRFEQFEIAEANNDTVPQVTLKGLAMLCLLRFSSAWQDRSVTFSTYLFLVPLFPTTLVPASTFGLCTTTSGILFSNLAGRLAGSRMEITHAVERGNKPRDDAMLGVLVIAGCVLKVSSVCLTLSVEREWPSAIGRGSSQRLTRMNTWIRRVDLICDLVAPLFVSGLSAGVHYPFAAAFLAVREFAHDLREFSKLPVFFTSLSIASIYLTVLSFDGTMLTFLKNTLNYSDPFLAAQRGVCTIAGLIGTLLFPLVMQRIGLVRTGSWAIWSEFACLIPVVVSLYVGSSERVTKISTPPWNAAMLFGGMALSRIGLWMFDLSQVQILQESLESHPRRTRLTSIQFIMQDMFDLAKYAITIGLAKPSQFRWAGLISVISVLMGGCLYTLGYARRVRGHISPHWRWLKKFKVI